MSAYSLKIQTNKKFNNKMKKMILLALLLVAFLAPSQAQVVAFSQSGTSSVDGYSMPRTSVVVTFTQERESVIRGPYSKFASKYLGISGVAQSDKENYRLLGASMRYVLEPDPSSTYVFENKADVPTRIFTWLSNGNFSGLEGEGSALDGDYQGARVGLNTPFSDMGVSSTYGKTNLASSAQDFLSDEGLRYDGVEKSVEQMASDAAAAIFKLRKRRFELVTGDQGENVFGQGLQAALDQINKLEGEYLSLFIGKRFVQVTERTFTVSPFESTRGRMTICRFGESTGLVSDADMSGRPINLEYTPEKGGNIALPTTPARRSSAVRTVPYRVPRFDVARVVDGTTMLSQERIPLYQFGTTVDVPLL